MEGTDLSKIHPSTKEKDEEEWKNLSQNLIQTLPRSIGLDGGSILFCEGIWYPEQFIKGLVYFQKYLEPRDSDIILASYPKSGTNWLKAICFTIVNRSHYSLKNTPLLTCSINQLVPIFESDLIHDYHSPNLDIFTQPRIFATHVSYDSLPCPIKDSGNKIVYICRNPLDQLVSFWFFHHKLPIFKNKKCTLDETFESFCQGNHDYGPFWDHILRYWHASMERPDKVLFLKYEDLKKDNVMYIKKVASFLGFPFSEDEEKQGLIQEISKLCSFESLKNLEVNKVGNNPIGIENSAYFRKGEVGDFRNYLSLDKVMKMEKLIQEKFGPFGLSFEFS